MPLRETIPDASGHVDAAGHDAHLASFPRRDDARAIGSDNGDVFSLDVTDDVYRVLYGDAFRYAGDDRDARIDRFDDGIGGEGGGGRI